MATAAVSLSPTLADLPLTGAEVVRIAFRLGILVDEVSQNLQPRDLTDKGLPDTWAYVIPDVEPNDVQRELDSIHAQEVGFLQLIHNGILKLIRVPENTRDQQSLHKRT